ncbi:MAG: aminoglycoside phosphotransferase family protein [Eubacteriales bacterium]|nr:aminoglycoside phosphotransferase family protein [Eubacteriales bacterium]
MERKLVGSGATADVYEYGAGKVLKLFHADRDKGMAEWEYSKSKDAAKNGLPVPGVYELLQEDGRWGFVMDRFDGKSLLAVLLEDIAKAGTDAQALEAALHRDFGIVADLLVQTHNKPGKVMDTIQNTCLRMLSYDNLLNPEEKDWLRGKIAELPPNSCICHGDPNPGNVLISPDGPIFIDWNNCAMGNPIFDVELFCMMFEYFIMPEGVPQEMGDFLLKNLDLFTRVFLEEYCKRAGDDLSTLANNRWAVIAEKLGEPFKLEMRQALAEKVRVAMAEEAKQNAKQ